MRLHAVPLEGTVVATSPRGSFVIKTLMYGLWLISSGDRKCLCPRTEGVSAGIDSDRDVVVAAWKNIIEV